MPLVKVKPYWRGRVVPRDGELRLEIHRQRVGAEVGDAPELGERHLRLQRQLVHHLVVQDIQLGFLDPDDLGGHVQDIASQRPAGLEHRLAADARAARGPGAAAVGRHARVARDDLYFVEGNPDRACRDLREDALRALPLLRHAAEHRHHPGGLQAQRRAVLRRDARPADAIEGGRGIGHLDHRRQPDAAMDVLRSKLLLLFPQLPVVHDFQQQIQGLVVRELLELDARGEGIGIGVVRDQVLPPELGGIHAELLRRQVDDALGERHRDRMADRAVLAGDVLVGEDDVHLRAVLLVPVGPAGEVHHLVALDAARARVDRVRADRGEIVQLKGQNFSRPGNGNPDFRSMLPRVNVGHERLEPVGDELHRPAQHDRERRGRHLVGIDVHLDAEGAADVLGDDAHVRLGDVQVPREDVLHHVRRLGGVVHGERVLGGVVVGEDRAALQAHARMAAEVEGVLDHEVRPGEGLVHPARVELALEADVVLVLGVNDGFALEGLFHVHDDGQLLPLRLDQPDRVLGLRARLGDHRGDRLALPAGALDGERVLLGRLDALQVREHRDPGRAVLGERPAVEHADDAFGFQCLREIELLDPRMRIRAAEERRVREPREAQVVGEGAAALQQPLRVRPRHALADVAPVDLRAGGVERELSLCH